MESESWQLSLVRGFESHAYMQLSMVALMFKQTVTFVRALSNERNELEYVLRPHVLSLPDVTHRALSPSSLFADFVSLHQLNERDDSV